MRKFKVLFVITGFVLTLLVQNLLADCMHQGRIYSWHPICNKGVQDCGAVLNFNCYYLSYSYCTGKDGNPYLTYTVKQSACPIPTLPKKALKPPKGWKYLNKPEKKKEGRGK